MEQRKLKYHLNKSISVNELFNLTGNIKKQLLIDGYSLINVYKVSERELLDFAKCFGKIFNDKYPIITVEIKSSKKIKSFSNRELEPHNEFAYEKLLPAKIILYCAQNSLSGGDFFLIDTTELIKDLGKSFEYTLRTKDFIFNSPRTNNSFRRKIILKHNTLDKDVIVFSTIDELYIQNQNYSFDTDLNFAIERLKILLRKRLYYQKHSWDNGDIIIFDNYKYMHGRESYEGIGRKLYQIRLR